MGEDEVVSAAIPTTRSWAEKAWVVEVWLDGAKQVEIGLVLGVTGATISDIITKFCWEYSVRALGVSESRVVKAAEPLSRREVAEKCLEAFRREGGVPVMPLWAEARARLQLAKRRPVVPPPAFSDWVWGRAQAEQALLLRCEGLTMRAIGARMGINPWQASFWVHKGAGSLGRAMKRTRWHKVSSRTGS